MSRTAAAGLARTGLAGLGAVLVLSVAAHIGEVRASDGAVASVPDGGGAVGTPAEELRLGYFPTVTHSPALVGVGGGTIADALEAVGTTLEPQVVHAGPAAVEALLAGSLDAAYLGPGPAINAFVQTDGEALRVVAGATTGGAQLVVRPGIDDAEDLRGATLASPQLGGTQDVALRAWLADQGLQTRPSGGGDVRITPTESGQTLRLFQQGVLDGAWLPEPWASRLVLEAGAEVLVDESTLWPGGRFLTTHLVVSTTFLREHPTSVEALLRGHLAALDLLETDPAASRHVVAEQIAEASGQPLPAPVLQRASRSVQPAWDPLAGTLEQLLDDAVAAGTTRDGELDGIYDLRLLNGLLVERGQDPVSAAGLGRD